MRSLITRYRDDLVIGDRKLEQALPNILYFVPDPDISPITDLTEEIQEHHTQR